MKLFEIFPGEEFTLAGNRYQYVGVEKGEVCLKQLPKGNRILYGVDALQKILKQYGKVLIVGDQDAYIY